MLDVHVANREAVHLSQPELESSDVSVTSQVARVLREHESAVVFSINERSIVNWIGLRVVIGESIDHIAATTSIEEID